MKGWNRVDVVIAAVILLLIGVEVCMEARFPCEEIVLKSESLDAIFSEYPEAEIMEKDRAVFEELCCCDGVKDLLDGGKNGFLFAVEDPDVRTVAEPYLGTERVDSLTVNVVFQKNGEVTKALNWGETGEEIFWIQETGSVAEKEYYKVCSFGSFPGGRTIYENWNNERARKSVTQRRWFAWLRDRMWED